MSHSRVWTACLLYSALHEQILIHTYFYSTFHVLFYAPHMKYHLSEKPTYCTSFHRHPNADIPTLISVSLSVLIDYKDQWLFLSLYIFLQIRNYGIGRIGCRMLWEARVVVESFSFSSIYCTETTIYRLYVEEFQVSTADDIALRDSLVSFLKFNAYSDTPLVLSAISLTALILSMKDSNTVRQ